MPNRPQKKKSVPALPAIAKELIDQFASGPMSAEAINAASMAFKKALIERVLHAELARHLGCPPARTSQRGLTTTAMAYPAKRY
jgi:putative transposase